jgi:hydroxyacylglutathione hydrolase
LVIDPNRNTDQYVDLAASEGLRITAVTETHIHADFASGALELAIRTGARLFLSDEGDAAWKYAFADSAGATLVHDGDSFMVGNIRIDVLHTPGHTPEHISFVLTDTAGANQPMGIFTGDFVFVGDVGRPDLLETAAGQVGTMEAGARRLYASLQRFKTLPDYLQVWPGHGAGSACGKALGAVPQSTVGYEKLFNWALNAESEERFVTVVLEGQPEPPFYFAEMKKVNKQGLALVYDMILPPRFASDELAERIAGGLLIVDTRPAPAYAAGHIPGTINIPLSKSFLTWAGWLLSYNAPFALIIDEPLAERAIKDLRLIALDNVAGYWPTNVVDDWAANGGALQTVETATADDVRRVLATGEATVLDVRGTAEYREGHIPGALHVPMGYIPRRIAEIPADKPIVVHCLSGARSAIAAGVLEALGRNQVWNYAGSYQDWARQGGPIEREAPEPVPADD